MQLLNSLQSLTRGQGQCSRKFLTFIVYMATLISVVLNCLQHSIFTIYHIYIFQLDNILLTVIVPILPDYLSQLDNQTQSHDEPLQSENQHHPTVVSGYPNGLATSNDDEVASNPLWNRIKLNDENSSVGILLATKALVQLIATPLVKKLINSYGYSVTIILGTFVLFVASFVFAIGQSYWMLLAARALQGFASAAISICGTSIIAQMYPEEKLRSQIIGILLGSMALGVLFGYTFGGIFYAFSGKSTPFVIIAVSTLFILMLQLCCMDLQRSKNESAAINTNCSQFLSDPVIVKIVIAIFVSTIAMATLEPCLPIWLMGTTKPEKWQFGIMFVPDSLGYFVSTNFFAMLAHRVGSMHMAIVSLFVVGISCFWIPYANTISSLILPQFALGMGIGSIDVALVPLLATIVDSKFAYDDETTSITSNSLSYGGVYALQQISVSLAYFLGPFVGGEIAQHIGFMWLMLLIGFGNIFYGILLSMDSYKALRYQEQNSDDGSSRQHFHFWSYRRFYETVDNR